MMNNFHEFYIDLKESDILHLQDGIDEERKSFKNKNIWEIILGYSEEPLLEFKKKLNSFGIFFKNESEYKDSQILLKRMQEERRSERKSFISDQKVENTPDPLKLEAMKKNEVDAISNSDDDKRSIEEALFPLVSMRNNMSKQVNKAQEKSEGSRSQRNIILACVIFVLLFCGIDGYIFFLIGYFSSRTPEKIAGAILFGISAFGTIILFIWDFFQIRRTFENFITKMKPN